MHALRIRLLSSSEEAEKKKIAGLECLRSAAAAMAAKRAQGVTHDGLDLAGGLVAEDAELARGLPLGLEENAHHAPRHAGPEHALCNWGARDTEAHTHTHIRRWRGMQKEAEAFAKFRFNWANTHTHTHNCGCGNCSV